MKHRRTVGVVTGCVGLALILGASRFLSAQQAPDPTRPASQQAGKVSLAEVGLPAGAASVTRFVYEPGRTMTPHTHVGRTSIITIVQGRLTERRGEVVNVYKAGDVIMVSEGTSHANENAGPDTLIYVEVNITGTKPGPVPAAAK